MPIKSAAAYWASRQAKLIAEDAQVHAEAEAMAQQRRTARNKKKKQRQKRKRQSLQVSAVENTCVEARTEHDEACVQPQYTEAAFSARGACWAQPSTATRDMQARLEEEAEGAGGGIPEGTQTAAASHTPDSPSVSPAALEAPAAEAACCHSESRPTKQHCAPAAVRDLAHAQVPASPARDKHTSTRAKPAAHNSAEPSGWYEAGQRGYVVGAGGTDVPTQPSTSHQGSAHKEQLQTEKRLTGLKRKLGAMEGVMVATQPSSQLAALPCAQAHYKSLRRLQRHLNEATQGRTCDAMWIKQQMANLKMGTVSDKVFCQSHLATAGCPALQSSNIGSLPAPSSPAKGLLPATSDTQPDAEGMPVAATDVDVPPTQQPLLHTEAVATDQLAGGQWHSRSDELPTLDLDTTPAASEATAPVLQSHLNRVTATATSLRAASKDQLSTSQPGVRQSSGEGQPAASQPYSIQANSLLPTCSDAATSALAPALHPQASFNHSTGLSSLGEQQVLVLDQPTAGCTSIEVATHVQCATHFTLPPNTGAAAAKRRIFAHGGRDAVPRYGHITQNVYTRGLVKPQRLHQDEVPVCTCHRSAASDGFVVPASLRRSGRHRARRQLAPGLIIDARRKGNIARLINHSCSPNCETQKWTDAATGATRIGIFARQDIDMHEELTYDYCFEHTGLAATDVSMYRCLCASPTCRGIFVRQGRW
ncbi:hypothetical protein ABBQ32_010856 [Trebouxia sp. C0010 RCD-2024]